MLAWRSCARRWYGGDGGSTVRSAFLARNRIARECPLFLLILQRDLLVLQGISLPSLLILQAHGAKCFLGVGRGAPLNILNRISESVLSFCAHVASARFLISAFCVPSHTGNCSGHSFRLTTRTHSCLAREDWRGRPDPPRAPAACRSPRAAAPRSRPSAAAPRSRARAGSRRSAPADHRFGGDFSRLTSCSVEQAALKVHLLQLKSGPR